MSLADFINTTGSVVQIIWGPCAAIAFWLGWKKERNKSSEERAINNALLTQKVEAITERMNKEFGGNSGGAREAINNLKVTVDNIDKKVDKQGEDLAKLTGRFDEHTDN